MTDREAMKLALEALEAEFYDDVKQSKLSKAITALREALASEAIEQPAQEQEPVACVQDLGEVKRKHLVYEKGMDWKDPLYTAPPQRKPLTDEEIERACVPLGAAMLSFSEVARAIEAAHGIGEKPDAA